MARHVKEGRLLCRLLDEAGLHYTAEESRILIPFVCSDSDIVEVGTEVELTASWRENLISIEMCLLELDEDEQEEMDPLLMLMLLAANYVLDICKFGLAPYGLSILVDFDARNLQYEEIESGIASLLGGFEVYLEILLEWFRYLEESGQLLFDEYEDEDFYEAAVPEWAAAPDTTTGLVSRALIGVAKCGVTAAVLAGIAATVGVPAAGIGAILAAVATARHT